MNFQRVYLWAFLIVAVLCVVLHRVGRFAKRRKAWRYAQNAVLYACVQCEVSLAFVGCYVLYVKNGFSVSPSHLGVAFFFLSVLAFCVMWRLGAFDKSPWSLTAPGLYSMFLLATCRTGTLRVLLYNPIYGFIGVKRPSPSPPLPLYYLLPLPPWGVVWR